MDRGKSYARDVMKMKGRARVVAILELPFTAIRRATVPLTSSEAYARGPLVLSLLGAPLWLCAYAYAARVAQGCRTLLLERGSSV